jgi:hypothetical protein
MEEPSFGPPVAKPVWHNVPRDTVRWATSLNLTGGPSFLCWIGGSSALIGKIGQVNPLLPAINLITGFVTINIFRRLHDHCQKGRGKDEIPQAIGCFLLYTVGCYSVAIIQAIAMGKCLGINLKWTSLSNPNHKVMWIALAAVGATAWWAASEQRKSY